MILFRLLAALFSLLLVGVTGALAQPAQPLADEEAKQLIVRGMSFSPDGKYLALGVMGTEKGQFLPLRYELWDSETGQRRQVFTNEMEQNPSVLFSPDGTKLIGYGLRVRGGKEPETRATVWEIASGKKLFDLPVEEPQGYFTHMAFSPDGTSIAAVHQLQRDGKSESSVYIWNTQTGQKESRWHESSYHPVAAHYIDKGQKLLLVGWHSTPEGTQTSLQELDWKQGKITRTHAWGRIAIVHSTALADSNRLALRWINLTQDLPQKNGLEIQKWPNPQTSLALAIPSILPLAIQFTPDERELLAMALASEEDRTFQLWRWDTQTGDSLLTMRMESLPASFLSIAAIAPDTQTVAIATESKVEIRRTSDGKVLRTLQVD